jgi:hypothetical protein
MIQFQGVKAALMSKIKWIRKQPRVWVGRDFMPTAEERMLTAQIPPLPHHSKQGN